MVVKDEHAAHDRNFDYSYDHLGNGLIELPNIYDNDFQEFLHRRYHVHGKEIHRHLNKT